MFTVTKLLTLALASLSCVAAAVVTSDSAEIETIESRTPRRVAFVGYRAMSPAEFRKVRQAGGRLIYEGNRGGGRQLGNGVYTSMTVDDWVQPQDVVCAVFTDVSTFNSIAKVNIPEVLRDQNGRYRQTWWELNMIDAVLTHYHPGFTADNTIRISQIDMSGQPPHIYQAVIGGDLVNNYDFDVECCAGDDSRCMDQLHNKYGTANYQAWGVHGGTPV